MVEAFRLFFGIAYTFGVFADFVFSFAIDQCVNVAIFSGIVFASYNAGFGGVAFVFESITGATATNWRRVVAYAIFTSRLMKTFTLVTEVIARAKFFLPKEIVATN